MEIVQRVRFDSLFQKITFSDVRPHLMWCIEIPDPTTPSTVNLRQFLIRDNDLKGKKLGHEKIVIGNSVRQTLCSI